ncbi:hypothetical protein A2924_01600 [Candidatus Giovannonibacteria bacterium RIFCSPLOWO2_01_FULL_44_16]|uniref:Acyl-CoA dehydrogenase n=1 Tax=Candidatus Giovannonibacteria bacterium RIFCSPLOWO2_01_FULL_44_16 TaxID=1798348 RepID=A0A1F5X4R1_9BACT|nr:MAG: hypothetical protein A2924_01600 [Candidatus Giovannonibacteria bacterium RIFCSPLOWO2_01_FULL_44_16]
MNLEPTKIQNEIRDLVRKIAEDKLRPLVRRFDIEAEYPLEFMKLLGTLNFLGVYIPEEFGGLNEGTVAMVLIMEEIAKVCPGTATSFGANALGTYPILFSGTDEQKKKYLPKVASGEFLAAFGLTEPGSGSDAMAMTTRAVLDGNEYILNGQKQFITSAGRADFYSIFARTKAREAEGGLSRGISCFIVEKNTPGLSFGKKEEKMGLHCSETRAIFFDNCRVPKENLIGGKEGRGVGTLLNTLHHSRIVISGQGLGLAQGARTIAFDYAKKREQFGRPISENQAISHKLANMEVQIEAARCLIYRAAWYADNKYPKDQISKFGAMAKLFSSEMAFDVANKALQVCGGIGYMRDFMMEKYVRDARVMTLYEGTSEMMLEEIFHILLKESNRGK